jgi:hypothetical protein
VTAIDCAQLADAAPELALGVLGGRERAEALEHLDGCSSCQQLVTSLSGVTDELLRSLAPSVEPSEGFEARVLRAMAPAAPAGLRRAKRRGLVASLAVAACVALLVGLLVAIAPSAKPAVASAKMQTANGQVVGWIFHDSHQPTAVHMTLPGWADQIQRYGQAGAAYSLRITDRTGAERVFPVALDNDAAWAATLDIDPGAIKSAALIDGRGHVWCQADFEST